MMTLIDIGSRVRYLRKKKGISAKEIAVSLRVSPSFISGIEKGVNKCSLENLDKICVVLDISLADFFSDKAPELPPEVRQVCKKLQKLTPEKLKILESVLDTWVESDRPKGD